MASLTDTKLAAPTENTLDPSQVLKASRALLTHIKKASTQELPPNAKRDLLAAADPEINLAETPILLTVSTKRHISDRNRLKPAKIQLRHSLNPTSESPSSPNTPTSTICLITADPQRAYKNLVASDEFPAALRARITRVVGYAKLKAKFKQYEAQRALFADHDIFLADDRIINRLPAALGKTFYKSTTKRPVPVVLSPKQERVDGKKIKERRKANQNSKDNNSSTGKASDVAAEIEKAVGSALVSLTQSTNAAIKVGYAGWTPEQIADNVTVVAETFVEKHVPQKWRNVKGIFIKGPTSAALPIWLTKELWMNENDVVADGTEEKQKPTNIKQKANIGKKRKAKTDDEEGEMEVTPSADTVIAKKPKKAKKADPTAPIPESNDDRLNQDIAFRKEKLRKQKASAKTMMED